MYPPLKTYSRPARHENAFKNAVAEGRKNMKFEKAPLVRGYANRILTVDLGTNAIATPALDP